MTNPAKNLAVAIAKQMAQEPFEILKDVKEQVIRPEIPQQKSETPIEQIQVQENLNDKIKSNRLLDAFNRELDDIRKQKLLKELQAKIQEGVSVPLENYSELSLEEKQVLNAQMEAVKNQMANAKNDSDQLVIPGSKKGRKMGGQKQQAQKEQTRVEKPVPPSG